MNPIVTTSSCKCCGTTIQTIKCESCGHTFKYEKLERSSCLACCGTGVAYTRYPFGDLENTWTSCTAEGCFTRSSHSIVEGYDEDCHFSGVVHGYKIE